MTRTLFVLLVVSCCGFGIYLRILEGMRKPDRFELYPSKFMHSDETLMDEFRIEGIEDKDAASLRLGSTRCSEALYLSMSMAENPIPPQLTSDIFPSATWKILRVHRGKLVGAPTHFERLSSFMHNNIRALFPVPESPLDRSLFTLAVPIVCGFEDKVALSIVQHYQNAVRAQ